MQGEGFAPRRSLLASHALSPLFPEEEEERERERERERDRERGGDTAEGGLEPTIGGNVGETPHMGATTMSGPVAPDTALLEVEVTISNPMSGNTADAANQPPEADDRLVERNEYGGYDVISAVENGENADPE